MFKLQLLAGLVASFALGITLASCGGGTDVQQETRTTTTGQELLDLQKAKDAGIISDAEYNRQRTAILNRKN